jgi:hypothetical protein
MTTSIFSDLKARILAAEADPEVDTASAAVDLLRDWLTSHETTLVERKTAAAAEFNGTMIQWFHWYTKGDGGHWRRLKQEARALAAAGMSVFVAFLLGRFDMVALMLLLTILIFIKHRANITRLRAGVEPKFGAK